MLRSPLCVAFTNSKPGTGNQNEYCGGADRLNLYMLNTSAIVPTGSSSTTQPTTSTSFSTGGTSSTTSSAASASPTGPHTVTTLAGWNYLGCYTEATNTRALNGLLLPITAANTSVENCAAACSKYTYFGVEYSQECYCGNLINSGSVNTNTVTNPNSCNMVCAANSSEYCGGRAVLNLYQVAPAASSSATATQSTVSSSSKSYPCMSKSKD
jgi:hypothetical protein